MDPKKVSRARVYNYSATRVQVAKAFPQWEEQKQIFDEIFRQQRLNKEHGPHYVQVVTVPDSDDKEIVKAKVPSSEFMMHLLDLHASTCTMCNCFDESEVAVNIKTDDEDDMESAIKTEFGGDKDEDVNIRDMVKTEVEEEDILVKMEKNEEENSLENDEAIQSEEEYKEMQSEEEDKEIQQPEEESEDETLPGEEETQSEEEGEEKTLPDEESEIEETQSDEEGEEMTHSEEDGHHLHLNDDSQDAVEQNGNDESDESFLEYCRLLYAEMNCLKDKSDEKKTKKSKKCLKEKSDEKKTKKPQIRLIKWKTLPLKYKCKVCEYMCEELGDLKEHIVQTHSNQQVCVPNRKKKSRTVIRVQNTLSDLEISGLSLAMRLCPTCDQYVLENRIVSHLDSHRPKELVCEFCGTPFTTMTRLNKHQLFCVKRIKCTYCDKEFTGLPSLQKHQKRKHEKEYKEPKRKVCEVCGKIFSSKHYRKHVVIHYSVKPYECPDCGKAFAQKSNMTNHQRIHTGDKPYKCDLCTETYAHKVSLKTHKKNKHGIDMWKDCQ